MRRKSYRVSENSAIRIAGTTKKEDLPKGNYENVFEVQDANRRFLAKPEPLITKPILGDNILPRRLTQELRHWDVRLRYSDYSLKSPIVTIPQKMVTNETLNEMGIIPERLGGQLGLSVYDLLHLLHDGEIIPSSMTSSEIHDELYDYISQMNPEFPEMYLIYQRLKSLGFAVQDGVFTNSASDFVIYDEPNEGVINELLKLDPKLIGSKTRRKNRREVSPYAVGNILMIRPGMDLLEIIRNQHSSDKADFKFYLAKIDAPKDKNNRLLEAGNLKLYNVRKNRMNLNQTPGKDAIVVEMGE